MKDISGRKDIATLVRTFYVKVRSDELLGPIFNERLTSEKEWEEHEIKLTNFWESTLHFKANYKGNPVMVHNEVDKDNNYDINHNHFGRWQLLWIANINEHFEGDVAQLAKNKARNMAHHLYLRMFQEKPIAKE